MKTNIFDMVRIITLKQQSFSQSDPVLIRKIGFSPDPVRSSQRHGNCRWIPPELQVKLSTTKAVLAVFTSLNNKEDKRELKVNQNSKTLPFFPSPHTSEECWTGQSHIADTSSHFVNSCHHVLHSWGAWLGCWSNNFANSHFTLFHSTADYCAPVWCRSAHTCLIDLPSTTPCELWLDACVLHQL